MPQLLTYGWGIFGGPTPLRPSGRVAITRERLLLIVDEIPLIDGLNPASPPGWWKAVDELGGKVAVVVVRTEDVDLHSADAASQLSALMNTDRAVWALLPVTEE